MFQTQVCSVCTGPHQSSNPVCVGGWVCVFAHPFPELSPRPIDGSHMTTLYKAASPLKWNTCSAIRQVLFYNSSKNKSVLQHYCFQPVGNDRGEEVFYGYFMGVVFMENLVVIDIIKDLFSRYLLTWSDSQTYHILINFY